MSNQLLPKDIRSALTIRDTKMKIVTSLESEVAAVERVTQDTTTQATELDGWLDNAKSELASAKDELLELDEHITKLKAATLSGRLAQCRRGIAGHLIRNRRSYTFGLVVVCMTQGLASLANSWLTYNSGFSAGVASVPKQLEEDASVSLALEKIPSGCWTALQNAVPDENGLQNVAVNDLYTRTMKLIDSWSLELTRGTVEYTEYGKHDCSNVLVAKLAAKAFAEKGLYDVVMKEDKESGGYAHFRFKISRHGAAKQSN